MARQFQKATLYVLKLEDPAGGQVPPFYKVGITTDTVDKRIRQLQTGNPFRIVPHVTMDIEGAELVERHLHRAFSNNRRILEWFRLDDDELSDVIEEAKSFRDEVEELVVVVRDLNQTPSTNAIMPPTQDALDLHKEALRLHAEKTQNSLRSATLKSRLLAMSGSSRGIIGITRVSIYSPKESFRKMELKKAHPDIYDQYENVPSFSSRMTLVGTQTPQDFQSLFQEKKDAAATVPKVSVDDVTDDKLDRTDDSSGIHQSYLEVLAEDGIVQRDLMLVNMRLKAICGTAGGIDGVCTYTREDKMSFDAERFKEDNPSLYQEFTSLGKARRTAVVMRSRDY